jgi:hypothetical protein
LLVEQVLGLGLCQGIPVGDGIRERIVPRRWPACQGNRWRPGRLADMCENARYWRGLGDKGDDVLIGTAAQMGQRREP